MISGIGNSAGGVVNNAMAGDALGALGSAGQGLSFIPGQGGVQA